MNEELPRERCLQHGATSLSMREILDVILEQNPRAMSLGGLILERARPKESFFKWVDQAPEFLTLDVSGLGAANQARMLCLFEFARRYSATSTAQHYSATRQSQQRVIPTKRGIPRLLEIPADAVPKRFRHASFEWIGFVPMLENGRYGSFFLVERGVRTHVNFSPVDLFAQILALRPLGVVLFHNHPSGCLDPSEADLFLTEKFKKACSLLGLQFLGHLIVSGSNSRPIELRSPQGK